MAKKIQLRAARRSAPIAGARTFSAGRVIGPPTMRSSPLSTSEAIAFPPVFVSSERKVIGRDFVFLSSRAQSDLGLPSHFQQAGAYGWPACLSPAGVIAGPRRHHLPNGHDTD